MFFRSLSAAFQSYLSSDSALGSLVAAFFLATDEYSVDELYGESPTL
jgi:hypothetical protein